MRNLLLAVSDLPNAMNTEKYILRMMPQIEEKKRMMKKAGIAVAVAVAEVEFGFLTDLLLPVDLHERFRCCIEKVLGGIERKKGEDL